MDTSLNLPAPASAVQAAPPPLRAVTTKVQAVEQTDNAATLPSEKPFIAQAVSAQLSGLGTPDNPSEITPPERTLRPYDVPMLPYAAASDQPTPADDMTTATNAYRLPPAAS